MSVSRNVLLAELNALLTPKEYKDFCPNGLQVQGSDGISKVVTGVTASQALIDAAVAHNADTILVHHGYFWKNEPANIVGMKYQRIKTLIENNINLIAFHLPLDCHPQIGNNAQLGQLLNFHNVAPLQSSKPKGIVYEGLTHQPVSGEQLQADIARTLDRDILWVGDDTPITRVAWCTGGGQGYIETALTEGADAFITGEVSEQTVHVAREAGIHFFSAGHHATERYGVKALGEWIAKNMNVDVQFVDIPNPA